MNTRSAQGQRVYLIDLIGKHDCIYVYFLISATVLVLFVFDMVFKHSGHLLNFLYFGYHAYSTINHLMAQKEVKASYYGLTTIIIYLIHIC